MEPSDSIYDRETYTHTSYILTLITPLIYAVEFFLDEGKLFGRNTDTIIFKGKYIHIISSNNIDSEDCTFSCIFDEVRENIMKHLYAHALIHTYEKFRVKNFYVDRLFCFEKLRSIFFDELSDYILDIKSFYFHIREYIMSKVLVFHDFFCNSSKSCKLSLEK